MKTLLLRTASRMVLGSPKKTPRREIPARLPCFQHYPPAPLTSTGFPGVRSCGMTFLVNSSCAKRAIKNLHRDLHNGSQCVRLRGASLFARQFSFAFLSRTQRAQNNTKALHDACVQGLLRIRIAGRVSCGSRRLRSSLRHGPISQISLS